MKKLCLLLIFIASLAIVSGAQCPLNEYQRLAPAEKSEIWRFRMVLALETMELSPKQAEHLRVLHDFASEGLYVWASAGLRNTLIGERAYELEGKTLELFTRKELKRVFGGERRVRAEFKPAAMMIPECACSKGSWFNISCDGCKNLSCNPGDDGCGFLGLYRCDGYCANGYYDN